MSAPLILIPCGLGTTEEGLPFHAVREKYIDAVETHCDAVALTIPADREGSQPLSRRLDCILAVADGILLTGSPSNVAPEHYGCRQDKPGMLTDRARDAVTLPLIRAAIAIGCPLLAICRGMQELNVALGGTLHQNIHETASQPGFAPRFDHREDKAAPLDRQYDPAHKIAIVPGSFLHRLTGRETIDVNSLHAQGAATLAPGLIVEARAEDGVVEAVRVAAASNFAYGVQWHPEWSLENDPFSQKLFAAFAEAVAAYAKTRRSAAPARPS